MRWIQSHIIRRAQMPQPFITPTSEKHADCGWFNRWVHTDTRCAREYLTNERVFFPEIYAAMFPTTAYEKHPFTFATDVVYRSHPHTHTHTHTTTHRIIYTFEHKLYTEWASQCSEMTSRVRESISVQIEYARYVSIIRWIHLDVLLVAIICRGQVRVLCVLVSLWFWRDFNDPNWVWLWNMMAGIL